MEIDLDKVFDVLNQAPQDVLVFGGAKYKLKPLTMLDVASFDTMRTRQPGETSDKHFERVLNRIRDLFDGDAPPFLASVEGRTVEERAEVTKKANVLAGVIAGLIGSASGNAVARAQAETTRQIEAAWAIGSG